MVCVVRNVHNQQAVPGWQATRSKSQEVFISIRRSQCGAFEIVLCGFWFPVSIKMQRGNRDFLLLVVIQVQARSNRISPNKTDLRPNLSKYQLRSKYGF